MRVALFQARSGIDQHRNAAALVHAIGEAAAGGATMLFTPEMSGLLDRNGDRAAAAVTSEEQEPVLAAVRRAAAEHLIWVQLGSLAIRRDDGRLVNRSFVVDDRGAVRARYDKMHLFDVDLPSGERWRESARYAAGDRLVAIDTPIGRLGLSICYDVRFGSLYSALAQAGAEVLAVPAAFTVPTGAAHWHVLLRARAIEAGAFVVAAAQCGRHEDGRQTFGHGLVVDPWGDVLLDMGKAEEAIAFAKIDRGRVQAVRAALPALSHRRAMPVVEVAA